MIFIAKGVAGGDVLDANDGGDVARVAGLDVLALVRLNLDQTRDALAFVGARIVDRVAFAQRAGVNAKENKFADEWITPKLEGERAERAAVVRDRLHRFPRIGVLTPGRRDIERTGQIIDHRVDEILDADILEGRAAD